MYKRYRKSRNCCYVSHHERKQNGWGINLYRSRRHRKIAGVCAGLAEHFDVDPWVFRLIFIGGFFMIGPVMIGAYIVGVFLLAPRGEQAHEEYFYDEERREHRPKRMFKYRESASVRLRRAQERLNNAVERVSNMERYVTSRRYELDREFSKIKDAP